MLAFALGAISVACSPAVPASPSYETDVLPILASHCVRCHGAGGTLNQARQPTGPDAAPLASDPVATANCYLNQYENTGCTVNDAGAAPNCHAGALYWAKSSVGIGPRVHGASPLGPMPPAPAPRLDDWELKVVDAWVANPICSASGSGPSSICPADSGAGL
jgi:hypothetical protein